MPTRTRTLTIALALSLALVVAACGGDDADGGSAERPTASQLSVKFRNEIGTTPAQGECLAEVLVSSDVSDGAMAEMYDVPLAPSEIPFTTADLSDDDRTALGEVVDDLRACVGGAPLTTAPSASPPTGSTPPGTSDPAATTAPGSGAGTDTTATTEAPPGTTGAEG